MAPEGASMGCLVHSGCHRAKSETWLHLLLTATKQIDYELASTEFCCTN